MTELGLGNTSTMAKETNVVVYSAHKRHVFLWCKQEMSVTCPPFKTPQDSLMFVSLLIWRLQYWVFFQQHQLTWSYCYCLGLQFGQEKKYKVPLKIQNVLIYQQGVERTNNCLASSCVFIVINILRVILSFPDFFLSPLHYVNCAHPFILNPWSTNQAYRMLCK